MKFVSATVILVMVGDLSAMANGLDTAGMFGLGSAQVGNSASAGMGKSSPNVIYRATQDDTPLASEELDTLCERIAKFGCKCQCKPTSSVLPTPTSTTALPSTTSSASCATPTCGSYGAEFSRYENPFKRDYSSEYDSFNLEYFESQEPLEKGVTNTIYLATDAENKTFSHSALEYRTFLYACQNGTYTFTSSSADDATLMWFGDDKVKNSTRQNADIAQFWYGDNSVKTVHKVIVADTYYPIRILWGNTEGAGFLNLRIFGPDGTELTRSSSTAREVYLVTRACTSEKPLPDGGEKIPKPGCGVRKWGSGWISATGNTDLASCKDQCDRVPTCQSFSGSIDGSINNCYLYDKPTTGVPAHPASNNALTLYMYDRGCTVPK